MRLRASVSKVARLIVGWRGYLLPVAVLATGGTALFGLLHALLIVPIWSQLASGIPRALIAAVGMTWCYRELQLHGRFRTGAVGGFLYGLSVWLGLLPVSLGAAALRAAGLRSRLGWLEPPIDLSVVALTGATVGFAVTRSLRVTVAAAACMAGALGVLTAPIAFSISPVERYLFVGLLPIYTAAGVVLALLFGRDPDLNPLGVPLPAGAARASGSSSGLRTSPSGDTVNYLGNADCS